MSSVRGSEGGGRRRRGGLLGIINGATCEIRPNKKSGKGICHSGVQMWNDWSLCEPGRLCFCFCFCFCQIPNSDFTLILGIFQALVQFWAQLLGPRRQLQLN